jgi:glutathione S-transferase
VYELFYWPSIQGRGEFVRLVLEDAEQPYRDVAREDPKAIAAVLAEHPHAFAPPILRDGKVVLAQTANITRYLGEKHGLAPASEAGRAAAATIALTIADLVAEVHDTHHPSAVDQPYEAQQIAAKARAKAFRAHRLPKFLGYLETLLGEHGAFLLGEHATYADLAAFQIVEGLAYAFPNAFAKEAVPRLRALRDRIASRPAITRYLTSPRRLPFSESGIFRHYPELDP